jgi:O-antigen ligase
MAALFGAGVAAFQYAVGLVVFRSDALMAAAYWLLFGGAVLAGQTIAERNVDLLHGKGLLPFWLAWVAAGILSWGMALHQWLDLQVFDLFIANLPPHGRPSANLAQPNNLATLLLLAVAGAIYLYETRTIGLWVWSALIVVLCQGLAMTQSRSVLVGFALASVAFFMVSRRCRTRLGLRGFVAIVAVYLAWIVSWPAINAAFLLGDDALSILQRTAPGTRLVIWRSALEAIAQKPLLGWGFGQISMAQQATALHYPATEEFFISAHNILLDILLFMGIPCVLLLLWFLYLHLRDGWKTVAAPYALWTAWLALAFVFGHALVELPLLYAYFLIPTGFLLGSISGSVQSRSEGEKSSQIGSRVIFVGGALLFIFIFVKISTEYLTWEENWRRVQFKLQKYANVEDPVMPRWILLDQLAVMQEVALQQPTENMDAGDLDKFRKNAMRYPSAFALQRYAYAAALNHQPEEAAHTLQLLCSLHPKVICNKVRKKWLQAGRNEWPQLQAVEFPQNIKYLHVGNARN